jgi:WD40 repeat protein
MSLAALGDAPGRPVQLFDVSSGDSITRLESTEVQPLGGAWRADGGLFAVAGATDSTIQLWDLAHAAPKRQAVAPSLPNGQGIETITFGPEGRHLVTGSTDGTICVWRLAAPGQVFRVP